MILLVLVLLLWWHVRAWVPAPLRSKEMVAGDYPYGGFLTNKKWHLNEASIFNTFTSLIQMPFLCRCQNSYYYSILNLWKKLIYQDMAKHLQYFQQVNSNLRLHYLKSLILGWVNCSKFFFPLPLLKFYCSLEVKFDEWQWK